MRRGSAGRGTPVRRRGVLVALVAFLAVTAASGCVPLAGLGGGDEESASPQVGQCYDTPDAVLPDPHDPSAALDCEEPHRLETFAVLEPGAPLHEPTVAAAGERCLERLRDFLGGGDFRQTALSVYYFTPTPAQREDGERWVRCDVGVVTDTAFTGTRRVTGSLDGAFSDGVPPALRRCLHTTPDPVAPQPLVSCLQPHFAQQMPTTVEVGDADTAYPGMDRLAERAQPRCARRVRAQVPDAAQALVVVPTAAMWRAGSTAAQCWATAAPGERLNDSEAQPA
jgi:hypothetical protein